MSPDSAQSDAHEVVGNHRHAEPHHEADRRHGREHVVEGLAQGRRLVVQPAVDRKCGARHRQHDLIRRRCREIGCHVVIPHDGGTPDRTDDPAIELFIHEAREAREDQPLREAPDLADAC